MNLTLDPQNVGHEAATAEFAEVAGWLQDHLGQQLAAYVVGLRDPKVVGKWRRGGQPRATAEFRARTAYVVARMLVDAYGETTARAWLLGSDSRLDDEAPAWPSIGQCHGVGPLREDVGGERGPKLVRVLVGHFTAGGTFWLRRKRLSGS
ncbi:MAG: hypothetical protein QOK21_3678 [Solirubrobacteraceae bacterium]|nr:hypothetical protein [Solirubrobacteraceae bacterium]